MGDFQVNNLVSESSFLTNPQDFLKDCRSDYTSVFGNAVMDVSVPVFSEDENNATPFSYDNVMNIYDEPEADCDYGDSDDEPVSSLQFEC
ncbi:MAG: hypothetical protein LUE64_07195 [Candidatus Gastranaerophilales bacterium]|nr:hypothetical protein [Candidatus Gastranaerophilales bacterium]